MLANKTCSEIRSFYRSVTCQISKAPYYRKNVKLVRNYLKKCEHKEGYELNSKVLFNKYMILLRKLDS